MSSATPGHKVIFESDRFEEPRKQTLLNEVHTVLCRPAPHIFRLKFRSCAASSPKRSSSRHQSQTLRSFYPWFGSVTTRCAFFPMGIELSMAVSVLLELLEPLISKSLKFASVRPLHFARNSGKNAYFETVRRHPLAPLIAS